MSKPLKIFITYAHKNTKTKDELITHLAVMKHEGLISIWHDNEITAGDTWRDAIFSNLDDSDILLYLVSAYSLASENCNKELAEALNADIKVISVILEDCDWKNDRLSDLQVLPEKGKPINTWRPRAKGWLNVVEGIREAIMELQSRADPLSTKPESELHAEIAFQRGNVQSLLGQTDMAIEAYSNAIHLNPRDARAYNNRGVDYGQKGEDDLAIKDFDKAIDLKPDYDLAYNNRGAVYRAKGEHDLAIKDCNEAIQLKPDYAEPYSNRGAAYRNKGDYERAIKDYDTAIKLKPDFVQAYYNRGLAYHEKREFDRAIEDYSKAIGLNPKLFHPYYNRGNAYLQKRYFDRAIEDYSKAIELNPEFGPAYCNRGEAWLGLKEWNKAKADLTAAKDKGVDIVAAFHNSYKDVETFERQKGFRVPEDIKLMLTQRLRVRYPKTQKILDENRKPMESPNVVNLLVQLRKVGTSLGEYVKVKPSFGIKTSRTEAFVVDRKTRDNLIAAHPSSTDILKPFLHGRALRRWHVEPQEKWLIFAHRGIEISEYPAILRHLENHKNSLLKRSDKQEWYELPISLDKSHRFSQAKLVCPNLYNHQTFAVDTAGFYCGDTCYLIPTEELWLCGLLNSRVVEWFYSQVSNQLTIDYLRARSGYMQQIPIPDITSTQKALIGKFVDYLIYLQQQPTINSRDLAYARDRVMLGYFDRIIDGMVYESYLPDELHKSRKHLFQPLFDERLPWLEEIQGDKMSACRDIFEHLYERKHPVAVNLFFLDSVKPIRIIESKTV